MNFAVRNTLAFIVGFVVGSLVNMGLVKLGYSVFPPPAGVDTSSPEGLKSTAHLLQTQNFIFPFLAHALGTFTGALTAYTMAGSHRAVFAWLIGGLTLCGGIAAAFMIPAPKWFVALDLLLAYLPMAWLATKVGASRLAKKAAPAATA